MSYVGGTGPPRSVHKNKRRITHVTSILIDQLDREPTGDELASALGIETADLATLQSMAQPRQLVSFDEMSDNPHGEENLSLSERLADPYMARPDDVVLSAEDRKILIKCLAALPSTQGRVIVLHYLQSMPLREVATLLAVTPSRVSQLHHQALGRLKHAWKRTYRMS